MPETKDFLSPAMRVFVKLHVHNGRALTEDEFIRHLVANEIRRWERLRGHAFDASIYRHIVK